jgi:hypothetical protein
VADGGVLLDHAFTGHVAAAAASLKEANIGRDQRDDCSLTNRPVRRCKGSAVAARPNRGFDGAVRLPRNRRLVATLRHLAAR